MVSARSLLGLQGIYYCVTGTWALVHIGSFIRVTGPKTDIWLVKTVGALVLAAGTVMVKAAFGSGPRGHAYDLATAMALAFAAVEAWYTSTGRISKVYAADALVELALAVGITAGRREDTEGTVAESPRDFRTLIDAGRSGSQASRRKGGHMDNVEYLEVAGRSSAFKLAGASHASLQLAAAADALAAARESRAVQMAPD